MRSCRRDDSVGTFGFAARPNKSHGAKTISSLNSWAWNVTSIVTAVPANEAGHMMTERELRFTSSFGQNSPPCGLRRRMDEASSRKCSGLLCHLVESLLLKFTWVEDDRPPDAGSMVHL